MLCAAPTQGVNSTATIVRAFGQLAWGSDFCLMYHHAMPRLAQGLGLDGPSMKAVQRGPTWGGWQRLHRVCGVREPPQPAREGRDLGIFQHMKISTTPALLYGRTLTFSRPYASPPLAPSLPFCELETTFQTPGIPSTNLEPTLRQA